MNSQNTNLKSNKIKKIKILYSILFLVIIAAFFIFLVVDIIDPLKEAIKLKDIKPLHEKFDSYGFWGPFFISLTQSLQVVIPALPSGPIQVIAGLTYGPIIGTIASITGIFLGNFIIYITFRKLGKEAIELFNPKSIEKVQSIDDSISIRKLTIILLSLYLIPGIPYGLIALTAVNSKMKFPRYIIITTLGTIPSLLYCILFGTAIIEGNLWFTIGLLIALIILSIIFIKNKNKILNFLASKESKYNMSFFQSNVRKPHFFIYSFFVLVTRLYFFTKFKIKVNKKNLRKVKKPYVVLYNHPSRFDYIYAFVPLYPTKVNPIIAYYYFCNFKLGKLLYKLGGFPKFLYQPDISSVKNIKRVINKGGAFGMAPEGRLSAYGCLETINLPTMKLLRNLNVPVILANIKGAYLSSPKWAKTLRRGRIEIDFENILEPDDFNKYTNEEIYKILMDKLNYDDFQWQEKKMIKYKGKKFAEGLEHILYICPVCHHQYSYESHEDTIKCNHCHTEVKLDNYYQFETKSTQIPKNIRDWYLYQKDVERKNVEDPNYTLTSNVTLKLPDPAGHGFIYAGQGTTTLTHKGVVYKGTINNNEKELFFKIENLPAILYGVNEDFEIYHHNTLYYFVPENIRECVKWSVVCEIIYEKYIKDNNINLIK